MLVLNPVKSVELLVVGVISDVEVGALIKGLSSSVEGLDIRSFQFYLRFFLCCLHAFILLKFLLFSNLHGILDFRDSLRLLLAWCRLALFQKANFLG